MLNGIFVILIVGAVVTGAFTQTMPAVTKAGIDAAKTAVDLAIGLVGQMALWLGFMAVLKEAGLIHGISRALAPITRRLFPDIPVGHPASAAIIMNIAANMMGLTNAATPFGLKAMRELQTLNKHKRVATDSMAMFLAINTSGVAVLPLGVIAIRSEMQAMNISGIIVPSILATMCSTIVAIIVGKLLVRLPIFAVERSVEPGDEEDLPDAAEIKGLAKAEEVVGEVKPFSPARLGLFVLFVATMIFAAARFLMNAPDEASLFDGIKDLLAGWLLPVLMALIVMFGFSKKVKTYEVLVQGAKEGFDIGVMIIPFLVAILVSIGMFRASGMMDILISGISPLTSLIGFPAEALPMAMIRPLSGSGALGVLMETMKTYGPDSFVGFLVSVMSGSTETTFYVLALYFGSVGVRATRHTVIPCLAADATGMLTALVWAKIFF